MCLSVKATQEAPSRAGGGVQDTEQLLGSQGSSEPRRGLCQKSEGTDLQLILQPPAESAHMLTPHLIK